MKPSRTVAAYLLATIAAHAVIFVGTASWIGSFGSVDVGAVAWSHRYYYDYASEALAGRLPYRDFAFEYPLLTFSIFLVPLLFVTDFAAYRVAFMAEMFLFDVAAIVLIARQVGRDEPAATVARRLGWYTLYSFLLGPLIIGRFELAPMVLAFAAAAWWSSGRGVSGGIAAGLGTLMKIFPGVVAAPAVVREAVSWPAARLRGTAAFLATLGSGLAAWLWLAGGRVGESVGYHAERGLEIESLFGGIVLLAGSITGRAVPCVFDHNAYHVAPEWGSRLATLALPIQAAALLLVMWRSWRSGITEPMRYSAAALIAFIVTGKVLSPQYLIWPLPFLAVLGGRTGRVARLIFLLGCITTALVYPGPGFAGLLDHQPGAIWLLNLRNGLLAWLLALLLFGPPESGSPPISDQAFPHPGPWPRAK